MNEVRELEDVLGAVRYWEEDFGRELHIELPKLRYSQKLLITNLSHERVIVDGAVELNYGDKLWYEQGPRLSDLLLLCGTGL